MYTFSSIATMDQMEFFVLDFVSILLTGCIVFLVALVLKLRRRSQEQDELINNLNKTVDRVLNIEAVGEIDGSRYSRVKRNSVKNSKDSAK